VQGRTYQWGLPIVETDDAGFAKLQQIGSSDPDFTIGWLNNVTYRGFMIHTHMHAQVGGNVYNGTKQRLYQHNKHGDVDQSAKADETKKPIPYYFRLYNANNYTEHFIEPGSFLKLRALSVQYRFNQNQLNRVGVGRMASGLSLGLNARNLFTVSNYSGFDPEVGSVLAREDYFNYPATRQITLIGEITF
jgi:hypothetical protein